MFYIIITADRISHFKKQLWFFQAKLQYNF